MSALHLSILRSVYHDGIAADQLALDDLVALKLIRATADSRCPYRLTTRGYAALRGDQ